MFRVNRQRAALAMVLAGVLALGGSAPAGAASQCGPDYTSPTACPITAPGAYSGTLTSSFMDERDYFVFYAYKNTTVSLTLTNAENPMCFDCGGVEARLLNASAEQVASTPFATVLNGIVVPTSLSVTLRRAGTYYLGIDGVLSAADSGTKIPLPYTFTIGGTPNVQWPPPCTVPALARKLTLAHAKRLIAAAECTIGRVTRTRTKRVRRGDVLAFRPASGTALPFHAPVAIVVSSGSRPKRNYRPKPKR